MRRISTAAVIGLLVAMQGCTINLPNNLFTNLGITATPGPASPPPTDEGCAAGFKSLDKNGDMVVTEAEHGMSGIHERTGQRVHQGYFLPFADLDLDGDGRATYAEWLEGCADGKRKKASPVPPSAKPIVVSGAFFGMASCEHALKKFDTDRDERLSPGEYAVWQLGFQAPAKAAVCAEPPADVAQPAPAYGVLRAPMVMPSPSAVPFCDPARPMGALPSFGQWDRDRDQFIDRAELCEASGTVPPQPPRPVCEDTFKRIDRNADGAVSPEEYFAGDFAPPPPDGMAKPGVMPSEGELAARFKGLDANADGRLDPREYCADWGTVILPSPAPTPRWDDCDGMVKSYDRNQDGQVAWEEYYEGFLLPISARYDGQKDEVYARFKGLDRSGDGVLTSDEYCPPDAQPTATPAPTETARTDDANR
jgi:Ca2+-binding EF-hand superfamily protein